MIKINKLLLIGLFACNTAFADDFNIDNLLNNIEKKSDLSEKTKLENGGVSYIYTREDITRMQAHNLKDILKSTYPFGYNENNFGISDPFAVKTAVPYMSSRLKIYIDNQELSTGLYGSGLFIYGNMDIDFVDHIEIYAGNPTLEFSTEPAFTIIKLYSKVAQKDEGSKIAIGVGSRGSKSISGYDTEELDNQWSYFAYSSLIDDNRKQYQNGNATLSRDSNTKHFFGKFYKDNQNILVDIIKKDQDAFIDSSLFATPKDSNIKTTYAHIGYDTKNDNLDFLISFDKHDTKTNFEDLNKPYSTKTDSASEVYTIGLNYHLNFNSNRLLAGLKYRLKHFVYDTVKVNNIDLPKSGHDQQVAQTAFIENQYTIASNKILTTGVSYSQVTNNHSIQDDNLFAYRFGYTYTNKNLISKTTASYLEVSLDPYLVNSIYLNNPTKKTDKAKQNIYMQNIKYKKDSNQYELIASYIKVQNQLMPSVTTGLLEAYKKDLKIRSVLGRYTKEYNGYDKLEFATGVNIIKNLPMISKDFKQYSSTIRNLNTFGKYDIFNEILYYKDNIYKKDFYDYSAGVRYHHSDDLTISLKGTNLLDKAKTTSYTRQKITNSLEQDTPLEISPIDKKVMITMEYTF